MREVGIRHTLLSVPLGVSQLHHLLGLFLTAPPQLCGMVGWNHALIRSKLDRRARVIDTTRRKLLLFWFFCSYLVKTEKGSKKIKSIL